MLFRSALRAPARSSLRVSVAAERLGDLEGLADLVAASGRGIVSRSGGRPPLDEPADVHIWDMGTMVPRQLAWLGMLTANRPGLAVIVVDSFPRPETVLAALQGGAAAVLGSPVSPESLAGALLRLESAQPTGLGRPAPAP